MLVSKRVSSSAKDNIHIFDPEAKPHAITILSILFGLFRLCRLTKVLAII